LWAAGEGGKGEAAFVHPRLKGEVPLQESNSGKKKRRGEKKLYPLGQLSSVFPFSQK